MTTIDYHIIGAKIRELRLERNMTQAALAEAADLSIPYLSHIERAMKKPSLKSLVQISNALGVTLDCLLTGNQVADTTITSRTKRITTLCTSRIITKPRVLRLSC